MRTKNILLFTTLFVMMLSSCKTNSKLNQENASKAIKEFVSTSNPNKDYLRLNSVKNIGNLSQFSDNEANSIVTIDYTTKSAWDGSIENGEFQLKCIFNKNVDNKWILTSIEPITNFNDWPGFYKWVRNSQNMNIIAQ
jgi:starvation-inducible outer membrane lipoprotein